MENTTEVNGITYGYTILPRFGKVNAEIYTVFQPQKDGEKHHIHAINKTFKRRFKEIDGTDYGNAKDWVEEQMNQIYKSNT